MDEEFIKYIESTRREFVNKVWETGLANSPENRVLFENLLIAYDQMVEEIKNL